MTLVYTVLTGDYEDLNEIGCFCSCGADETNYVCFTDSDSLVSTNWLIFRTRQFNDAQGASRQLKMLSGANRPDGEIVIYKDNTVTLKKCIKEEIEKHLLDNDIVFFAHSTRSKLFYEFVACEVYKKDSRQSIRNHFLRYATASFNSLNLPLLWGGFFAYRVGEKSKKLMNDWYQEFLLGAKRDQLSLPYVLDNSGIKYLVLQLPNKESEFHVWPVKLNRKQGHMSGEAHSIRFIRRVQTAFRYATVYPWYLVSWSKAYLMHTFKT